PSPAAAPRQALLTLSPRRVQERDLAREIARKLAPEFAGFSPPETIERGAVEGYAYYSSLIEAGETVANYLPIMTERFVRNRLRFVRTDRLAFTDVPEVLFVCIRNAGRSQIAAALLE